MFFFPSEGTRFFSLVCVREGRGNGLPNRIIKVDKEGNRRRRIANEPEKPHIQSTRELWQQERHSKTLSNFDVGSRAGDMRAGESDEIYNNIKRNNNNN